VKRDSRGTVGSAVQASRAQRLHWPASAIAAKMGRVWQRACGFISKEHLVSVVDQAIVSGTSFLTTLMIARYSDAGQLGLYAIGISLLLSLVAFQDSLILQPYTIQRETDQEKANDHTSASLALSGFFSAGSVLALFLVAIGFFVWGDQPGIVLVIGVIAGIVPFALVREFARRVAFAHLEMTRALLLDACVAFLQLSTLGFLGASGRMSAAAASIALGVASAITVVGWLFVTWSELTVRASHVRTIFRQTWALGKWLLVGRITVQIQGFMTYWIALFIAGATVTGLYAACMSVVNFINPLVFALGNVMAPKLVLAWKDGGGPGLWHEAVRNAVLISAPVAAFSMAIFGAGDYMMHFLYHSEEYAGQGHTLTVLALAMLASASGMPASFGLATMGRPRAIVVVGFIAALLSVALVCVLMFEWGLLGAAYGLLAGNVAGTIGRWVAFSLLVPPEFNSFLVIKALEKITNVSKHKYWTIKRVGGGEQAEVFLCDAADQPPLWKEYRSLVVKLYKPEAALTLGMVQAQFDSLSGLYGQLNGRRINGWTISVPRPLYLCPSPLAFVMTFVPGQNIESRILGGDVLKADALQDAARAFAAALEICWSNGRRHADLGLRNVLFDLEAKEIAFIDAGTRESCRTCSEVERFPSAAASDLAHVLCDVATDVTDLTGSPVRLAKELFFECVLRTVIESAGSETDKRRLLNQIQESLQEHLTEYLDPSWSFKGVSHSVVRQVAISRVRSMLDRVVAPHSASSALSQNFHQMVELK
jgi:O-antigen/teichoic acid export membrane protein